MKNMLRWIRNRNSLVVHGKGVSPGAGPDLDTGAGRIGGGLTPVVASAGRVLQHPVFPHFKPTESSKG